MGNNQSYFPTFKKRLYENTMPGKNTYKKNNKYVFWKGQIVANADVQTFVDMKNGYGQDKSNIYYKGKTIVEDKDFDLKVLNEGYAKYGSILFYKGYLLIS